MKTPEGWEPLPTANTFAQGPYTLYGHERPIGDENGEVIEHFTISSFRVWVSGRFATPDAALFGAQMCPSKLSWAWDKHSPYPLDADTLLKYHLMNHENCHACNTAEDYVEGIELPPDQEEAMEQLNILTVWLTEDAETVTSLVLNRGTAASVAEDMARQSHYVVLSRVVPILAIEGDL